MGMRTGRPPLPPGKARYRQVALRLSSAEYEQLRVAMRKSGFNHYSKWVRSLVLKELKNQ